MDFNSVMKEFAARYSLDINPVDGAVVLDFNAIPVSFMESGEGVVVHAPIGENRQDAEPELLHSMLAANAALADEGFAICQDNSTEGFAIVRYVTAETLDAETLAETVAAIVPRATEWQQKLAEPQYTISGNLTIR